MKIQTAGDKAIALLCDTLRARMLRNMDQRGKAATQMTGKDPGGNGGGCGL
jgi:hypothetical protein